MATCANRCALLRLCAQFTPVHALGLRSCNLASVPTGAQQDPGLVSRWGGATFQHLARLHASAEGARAGCVAVTGYALWTGGDNATPVSICCRHRQNLSSARWHIGAAKAVVRSDTAHAGLEAETPQGGLPRPRTPNNMHAQRW